MIIITGSVRTRPEARDELIGLCVEHSQRSRAEPGCIAHNVHFDCEDAARLVFLEVWADGAAVKTHFAVPESGAFVRAIGGLAAEAPTIQIYNSDEIPATALG